ncbi:bifunctional Delta(1)-pyrroline-2-carboxylate/Delta(1)-piperideine-2-carboxylate reductase [Pseudoduganella rhizocola]|uniref:bifunctional Delta(1)-pyrroline-2-carboxylate/Delta(1)-piperideine-2- carboxylate reductase n=1 Tax=Pseudoduganella rhizocola TaxID=3382643 RepID=UPI0038B6059D
MTQTLNAEQTAALLPYPQLVRALRTAVAELAQGAILCPARQVEPLQDGALLLSMIATAQDVAVHKLISVVPQNPARGLPTISGRVSVVDAVDGMVRLVLDGATVTGRRTAALSMLGVEVLLGRAPRHVLLVGAGTQALNHAQALAALYPEARLSVVARSPASVTAFCAQAPGTRAGSLADLAEDIDLVITCTTSRQPVYQHAARAGRLLIAVGAFKPHAAEIASATVRASRIFVDDPHGAHHEAGDLLQAGIDWAQVKGISAALDGVPMADTEAVLFKTVGCAAWDLAAARVALANSG